MHICMVKVVSLSNEAYGTLKRLKREEESFSDVVLRLSKRQDTNIKELFGIAKEDRKFIAALRKASQERKKLKLRVY